MHPAPNGSSCPVVAMWKADVSSFESSFPSSLISEEFRIRSFPCALTKDHRLTMTDGVAVDRAGVEDDRKEASPSPALEGCRTVGNEAEDGGQISVLKATCSNAAIPLKMSKSATLPRRWSSPTCVSTLGNL